MANYQSVHSGSNIDYVISNALLQSTAASIYLTKADANTLYPLKNGTGASGTWSIDITGNSHTTNLLNNIGGRINSPSPMIADGKMRLFLSTSAMTIDKPPSGDGHILHLSWDNAGGWDNQIAIGNTNAGGFMAFRCGSGSGDTTTNTQAWSGWRTILDSNNYHNYTRSSEELTDIALTWSSSYSTGSWMFIYNNETGSKGGRLLRAINQTNTAAWVRGGASGTWNIDISNTGRGSSWIAGRSNAHWKVTTISGYSPAISIKSTNGSWEIGTYDNSSFMNMLIFSYCTDSNFNAGTNTSVTARITPAGAFTNASKREYKTNIQKFNYSGLDIINSTNICSFNMKGDPNKDYRVGFIADDTHPIISGKNQDIMDLQNCIGVLMKAVQELSAEIKELKERK